MSDENIRLHVGFCHFNNKWCNERMFKKGSITIPEALNNLPEVCTKQLKPFKVMILELYFHAIKQEGHTDKKNAHKDWYIQQQPNPTSREQP
jgi:hypothetical protein